MNTDIARARLVEERARLEDIRRALEDEAADAGGELSSADQHPADNGTDTFERAKDLAILDRTQRQLADVARALDRLDRGEYGMCEACGQPIGEARLAARPAARLCLRDQELAEAEESAAAR
jgi:RNA polymerase-binding protein DksA